MNSKKILKIILAPFIPFLLIALIFIAGLSFPPVYVFMFFDDSVSLLARYVLAAPFTGWIFVISYGVFKMGYEIINDILGE